MKKILALLLALVMVFAFAACGGDDSSSEGGSETGVTAPESDVEMSYMTADELESALAEGDDSILIVDVRKAADYETSHIPGSVSIDMDAAKEGDFDAGVTAMRDGLTAATDSETGGDKTLVLVCYSGASYAQASTNVLSAIGANMDNVLTLEGGFNGWSETYPDIVAGGEETVEGTEMSYITAEELKTVVDEGNEDYLIVDVRKAADYETSHIPGAVSIDMDAAKEGDFQAGVSAMKLGLLQATGSVTGGDKTLVLVCYSGARYAQASTDVLSAIGANMDNVLTLEGGFNGWSETYADTVE